METQASTPILPPRPNLGPEGLGEPSSSLEVLGLAFLALGLLGLLGLLAWRLRTRRRKLGRKISHATNDAPGDREPAVSSELPEIVWLAQQCRRTLVARFGDFWAAKTTEEVGEAPELVQQLGRERIGELLGLLHEADRIKFADDGTTCEASELWRQWVSRFVAEVEREPEKAGKPA